MAGSAAVVSRVVPGKMLYVETKPSETCVFKLDQLEIRHADGSITPYRGEPLSEIVNVGQQVFVLPYQGSMQKLLVDRSGHQKRTLVGTTALQALKGLLR